MKFKIDLDWLKSHAVADETENEYFAAMKACGFAIHEIEECWNALNRYEILAAAELDGERYVGPEAEC